MEKQIALVNKITKRVKNVLVIDSLDKEYIKNWATDELEVVPVKNSIPYVNGLWDGKQFTQPSDEYLIEIGLITSKEIDLETEAKAAEKQALLDRLGITADEAKLLLG